MDIIKLEQLRCAAEETARKFIPTATVQAAQHGNAPQISLTVGQVELSISLLPPFDTSRAQLAAGDLMLVVGTVFPPEKGTITLSWLRGNVRSLQDEVRADVLTGGTEAKLRGLVIPRDTAIPWAKEISVFVGPQGARVSTEVNVLSVEIVGLEGPGMTESIGVGNIPDNVLRDLGSLLSVVEARHQGKPLSSMLFDQIEQEIQAEFERANFPWAGEYSLHFQFGC
jgi:hypothetical protein